MRNKLISFIVLTTLIGLMSGSAAPLKAEIVADENISLVTGEVISAEERDPMFSSGLWTITLKVTAADPVPVNADNPAEGNYANLMEKYVGKTIKAHGRIFRLRVVEKDLREMSGKQINAYVILRSFDDFSIQKITVLKPQETQK